MTIFPTLSPPENLGAAIAPIAALSDDEFVLLEEATSSWRSFLLKPSDVKSLSSSLPALSNNLPYTLQALSFLYSRLEGHREKVALPEIAKRIIADFEVVCEAEQKDRLEQRLARLLRKNDSFVSFRKTQRLRKGFIPNATGFRSMVDLRPDFGSEKEVKLSGLLTIIQFRIMTDREDGDGRELVFQMSEDALDELSKAIDRARQKLALLKENAAVSSLLIERD